MQARQTARRRVASASMRFSRIDPTEHGHSLAQIRLAAFLLQIFPQLGCVAPPLVFEFVLADRAAELEVRQVDRRLLASPLLTGRALFTGGLRLLDGRLILAVA